MDGQPAVYILASKRDGGLYTGVTSDLVKRDWEHKGSLVEGFTKRRGVHHLVRYERHGSMDSAIERKKRLKKLKRKRKVDYMSVKIPIGRIDFIQSFDWIPAKNLPE